MATTIIMPQGGQDITEGTVVNWLKQEGETVRKGEVICEVETEKAVFEVQAPADGTLLKILAQEGQKVPIFSVIGVMGDPGEDITGLVRGEKEEEEGLDIEEIRRRLGKGPEARTDRIKVSGRAKKIAEEKAIDLSEVEGTGPSGRITEKDVLAVAKRREAQPEPPRPEVVARSERRGRTVRMSKMRAVIARRMQQSKQTIPHFYVTVSVDMTDAMKFRDTVNSGLDGEEESKISINDMITKSAALALEEFYQVNCTFQDGNIVYLHDVNIGIAVGLDEGLIVPVLPGAHKLSLREIAQKTREIVTLSRAGKQASFTPGSFTITNMGMFHVENFVAIINPPESAILSVGSTEKRVVVGDDNALRIRDMMKMTLSIDHRLVDGVLAAQFVNKIKYHLQNPKTLLP
jgi:pyruvate dehydrogenase E2 component (dihydrolipoamide acetyltransferase)